ncbi:MAG: S1/P1 nuclease [Bdellovibrionaceae bacterium]|nr:S1/P1 nuclease [Pseudobdellovibrionaceae bacterium]
MAAAAAGELVTVASFHVGEKRVRFVNKLKILLHFLILKGEHGIPFLDIWALSIHDAKYQNKTLCFQNNTGRLPWSAGGDVRRLLRLGALGVVWGLSSAAAWGWGKLAHRASAFVAEAHLTPQARSAVRKILVGESLADVSAWADSLRADRRFKHTVWYHFEKIEDSERYLDALQRMTPEERGRGGAVAAILVSMKILRDPYESDRAKEVALKFLVHFIGDIHQPLHTGRPEDNGAVKIDVSWFGIPMSLHGVWDSGMIITGHSDLFENTVEGADFGQIYAQYLLRELQRWKDPLGEAEDIEAWVSEAMRVRPEAYDPRYEKDQTAYQADNLSLVDRQVYASGVRLAGVLNRIFARYPVSKVEQQLWNMVDRILNGIERVINLHPR